MRALLVALVLLATAGPARAQVFETVSYRSDDGTAIGAIFARPAGERRHPAVILLHGCGGRDRANGQLGARHEAWADLLLARGYAVLLPESFASRGRGSQCAVRERAILPWRERRADAIGARDWLRAQALVDPARIALFGWSHGGSTVLATADAGGFAAMVAFYPGCARAVRQGGFTALAPMLLLIGSADDWTPPAPCRELAAEAGPRLGYVEYPNAFHGFDEPNQPVRLRTGLAFSLRGDGTAHVGTDPAARDDAMRRVPEFLDAHLNPRQVRRINR